MESLQREPGHFKSTQVLFIVRLNVRHRSCCWSYSCTTWNTWSWNRCCFLWFATSLAEWSGRVNWHARCCMLKKMILEKLWDPKAKTKQNTAAHTQSLIGKQNTLFSHSTFSTSGKLTCGRSNIGQAWAQISHGSSKWPAALSRENTWDDSFTIIFLSQ